MAYFCFIRAVVSSQWTRPHFLSRAHSSWPELAFKRAWLIEWLFFYLYTPESIAVALITIKTSSIHSLWFHYLKLLLFENSYICSSRSGHYLSNYYGLNGSSPITTPLPLLDHGEIGHSTTMPCAPSRTALSPSRNY